MACYNAKSAWSLTNRPPLRHWEVFHGYMVDTFGPIFKNNSQFLRIGFIVAWQLKTDVIRYLGEEEWRVSAHNKRMMKSF